MLRVQPHPWLVRRPECCAAAHPGLEGARPTQASPNAKPTATRTSSKPCPRPARAVQSLPGARRLGHKTWARRARIARASARSRATTFSVGLPSVVGRRAARGGRRGMLDPRHRRREVRAPSPYPECGVSAPPAGAHLPVCTSCCAGRSDQRPERGSWKACRRERERAPSSEY